MSLTLYLGERELECRAGSFTIHVLTERWVERKFGPFQLPGRWEYNPALACAIIELEVDVDDDSGGDGEPAPRLEIKIPPDHWQLSSIREISGSRWSESRGVSVVGWYGNDAPEIEKGAISFGSWNDDHCVAVEWIGTYRWRASDTCESFRLDGAIKFSGLSLRVKDQADVSGFLAAALPGFSLDGLELQPIEIEDFGPEMPDASRRRWESHHWLAI